MNRTATTSTQFLTWIGDVPYMVTWTPGPVVGTLSATLAGDFLGADDWSQTFPVDAVEDIGLDNWAMQTAAIQHAAAAGRGFTRQALAA